MPSVKRINWLELKNPKGFKNGEKYAVNMNIIIIIEDLSFAVQYDLQRCVSGVSLSKIVASPGTVF